MFILSKDYVNKYEDYENFLYNSWIVSLFQKPIKIGELAQGSVSSPQRKIKKDAFIAARHLLRVFTL